RVRPRSRRSAGAMVCCMSARSDAMIATGSGAVCARQSVSSRWCTAPADALPISYGIVSRSGNERTRSSPSQAASSARQRRARSSLGATTTTVLRETSTSDAHANARAPAVASAILVERRSSRRSARSRNRSLRSASARMPPRRAADPTAVVLAIELVHRSLDAVADRDLRGLGPADDHLVRVSALVRREWREHVLREVGDLDGRIHRGDADPQARKPLADLARDRAHPVVRSRTATLAQPHLAEGEVDLVEDDEERVGREPVAVEQLPDGTPAVVHERLRSRDGDPQIAERALSDTRLRGLGVEFQARTLGESVRDLETDVVARVGVPIARITEADDEAIDAWRSAAREEFRQMDQAFSPFYLKDAEKGLHRKRRWGPADAYRSKDTREGPPTGPLAAMRVCRRGARDPGSGR